MKYSIAERFRSLQGEGVYTGTPMAFIRFLGCSVGKRICNACDTDFEKSMPWRGGGDFDPVELLNWSLPYRHICLTGGEPFDQDLQPLFQRFSEGHMFHVETSGTKPFPDVPAGTWICVSPKPGFLETCIRAASEVKVIVPGLGAGSGWPTLADALRWAELLPDRVFLQPRNAKLAVDKQNLKYVLDLLREAPTLRLSCQLHKILGEQ